MKTRILQEFGLTDSEIKVFLALLKIGPARAGEVIKESGLQNPVVHRAFHSLANKGIVTNSVEGKIKYYSAIEPSSLVSLVENQKKELESIIPELNQLYKQPTQRTKTSVHQGKRGVRELVRLMLRNCSDEVLMYGAPKKSSDLLESYFWDGFHNERIKNKISAKMIFHESLKSRANQLSKLKKTSIRLTSNRFEDLVETIISDEMVAIIVYLENPVGILIEDKSAAKSYKIFFDLIWKSSDKI